jgi:folate-binding protein YgfZ
MTAAKLDQYGLLQVTGAEAGAFLHAQLTNDIEHLPAGRAQYAGWCTAQGRLLATFLVIRRQEDFLLQLSRDIAPAVAKRLGMFILRAKVKLADVSAGWHQYGVWDGQAGEPLLVKEDGNRVTVRVDAERELLLAPELQPAAGATAEDWLLAEVRAGRPLIAQPTQDQFVPQMVNLELAGGVDFRKGCYPGQEIVARAQYRGTVKRRMYRVRGTGLQAGAALYSDDLPGQPSGTVVNAAGGEALAVLQVASVEAGAPIRPQSGAALEILSLPYSR